MCTLDEMHRTCAAEGWSTSVHGTFGHKRWTAAATLMPTLPENRHINRRAWTEQGADPVCRPHGVGRQSPQLSDDGDAAKAQRQHQRPQLHHHACSVPAGMELSVIGALKDFALPKLVAWWCNAVTTAKMPMVIVPPAVRDAPPDAQQMHRELAMRSGPGNQMPCTGSGM